MDDNSPKMIEALKIIDATTSILLEALQADDKDKAHEAVSIMFMQGMDIFGPNDPTMQQFFPVWEAIKNHIVASNIEKAKGQTKTWQSQLQEVIQIFENS